MSKMRTTHSPSRREFLSAFAAAVPSLALARTVARSAGTLGGGAETNGRALVGSRFLTFATVVRVNQIEAARDKSIGDDETCAAHAGSRRGVSHGFRPRVGPAAA